MDNPDSKPETKVSVGTHVRLKRDIKITPSSEDYSISHGPGVMVPAGKTAAVVNTGPIGTYLHGDEDFEGWLFHHVVKPEQAFEIISREPEMPAGFLYRFLPSGNAPFDDFDNAVEKLQAGVEWAENPSGGRMYRVPVRELLKLPREGDDFYLGDENNGYSLYRVVGLEWWKEFGFKTIPHFVPVGK